MRKLVLTIAMICVAQIGMAQDEAFKKDIMKVIELSETGTQIRVGKEQILKMVPADKQAAFVVEFDATLPALYDKMVKVYAETYTKEDIKAMLAFYDSPVGKKITAKSGELAEKAQAAGVEWGQSLQTMMMKYMQ